MIAGKKRFIPLALILAVAVAVGAYWLVRVYSGRAKPLRATGVLEAVEVDVAPLVPGRVVAIAYEEGDEVKKGAVVATLDAEELSAGAAAAAAAAAAAGERVAAARAAYSAAEDRFGRIARAYPGGGVTRAEYERAKAERDRAAADYASARSLAAQAEATGAQLEARRREVEVRAPISGVVLSRNLEPGEVLAAGAAVITLADLSTLRLYVYIPETKIGLVNVGDAVTVKVDSFPGEEFAGRVHTIRNRTEFTPRNVESKEERVTLVFKVTVTVPNAGRKLKPGMPADVVFEKAVSRSS